MGPPCASCPTDARVRADGSVTLCGVCPALPVLAPGSPAATITPASAVALVDVPPRPPISPGATFHYLTVVAVDGADALCRCLCGTKRVVALRKLHAGHTLSCGCWRDETSARQQRVAGARGAAAMRAKALARRAAEQGA